jgi:hypothetical protein
MKSLTYYKGTGYGQINKVLRENDIPLVINSKMAEQDSTLEHISNIDKLLNQSGFKGILYRAIQGNTIIEKAYSSTTPDLDVARQFTDYDKCCVVSFKLPNDIKYHYFEHKIEPELLLQRSLQYYNITEHPHIRHLYTANVRKYEPPKVDQKSVEKMRAELMAKMLLEEDEDF